MREFLRYGLNGAFNTILTYALYVVLVRFIDFRIAIVVVYVVGMALLYFLHSALVFGAPGRVGSFVAVYICTMIVNMLFTWYLVERYGWPEEAAQVPAIILVFVLGYFLNRRFVFDRGGG